MAFYAVAMGTGIKQVFPVEFPVLISTMWLKVFYLYGHDFIALTDITLAMKIIPDLLVNNSTAVCVFSIPYFRFIKQ